MERGLLAVIKGRWSEASRAWEYSLGQNECLKPLIHPLLSPPHLPPPLATRQMSQGTPRRPPLFCHLGTLEASSGPTTEWFQPKSLMGSGKDRLGKTWIVLQEQGPSYCIPISLSNPQWVCQPWLLTLGEATCVSSYAPFQANEFFRFSTCTIAFL